jgi:hypothetical protein
MSTPKMMHNPSVMDEMDPEVLKVLEKAISTDDGATVEKLIASNVVDIDVVGDSSHTVSLAFRALRQKKMAVFDVLFRNRCDVNMGSPCEGLNLLLLAILNMDRKVVQAIIDRGGTFQCKESISYIEISKRNPILSRNGTQTNLEEISKWARESFHDRLEAIDKNYQLVLFGGLVFTESESHCDVM